MSAKVYLIPNIIAPQTETLVVTPQVRDVIAKIDFYLAENIRNARRFISSLKIKPVDQLHFEQLDKNTSDQQLAELVAPLMEGQSLGIISEAGCPGVADPGSMVVAWAHKQGIAVIPLVGASSILLALMASGLNGQHFEFHGYLPIEGRQRQRTIKRLENESAKNRKTQIFMETPYRNQALMTALVQFCQESTKICVACNLTAEDELVRTMTVAHWKKSLPDLHKKPAIFLLLA
ncbi:MAG: SAM-dependent methyltransferase [Cyclobacteriaceae bacterium]|nr:SAM-dependent methyltransferase [Cyclobacteriaceae bacterium]